MTRVVRDRYYVVSGLVYDDEVPVTFEVETRAETIDHGALLRLGVDHATEQHFWHSGDVHVPNLDDPYDQDEVRDWLAFVSFVDRPLEPFAARQSVARETQRP